MNTKLLIGVCAFALCIAPAFAQPEGSPKPKDEAKAIEERMLDKGIQPFPVQAIQEDAVTSKLIYAHIGVGYKEKPEEILAQIVPEALPELEYRLASTIYKLTQETPPVVAGP